MKDQRMKWDAEAAFKSLNAQGKRRQASIDDERLKTTPYTPPPAVAAWLKAQADKPKAGRDIGSLMRYHAAHKKGRTDDDCLREKFGGVAEARRCDRGEGKRVTQLADESPKPKRGSVVDAGSSPATLAAPTPPQSADGGQPLPSAGHGKDVDTAGGPWPKCLTSNDGTGLIVYTGERDEGTFYGECAQKWKFRKRYADALAEQPRWSLKQRFALPLADAIAKLEQNGHADAAAQLRGKARDDVATGGGRVWEDGGFAWAQINGVLYCRVPVGHFVKCVSGRMSYMMRKWELFGPERDAILAECRKAMGL